MAEAIKCDVINCGQFQSGASGRFVDEENGVAMHTCKTHTGQIMSQLFPDFIKKPEVTTDSAGQQTVATPAEGGEQTNG